MVSPRDFYKSRHPDLFSDSVIEEATEIDRSLLEYYLSSLTNRSQEVDFERFARGLCEREICPNLLPTTGPTGGGDSKADSETYPVADRLTLSWYDGIGREASHERWAFAFSAKEDWPPKVKSDVKKIVETGRGYTTAFFVTNQYVPARKRAAAEDDLRNQYGIRVTILDRTWILERVFTGRHEDLAISELKITGLSTRNVRTGRSDAARLERFHAAEARIAAALQSGNLGPALVDDALEAAEACRSLERPRTEVEGCHGRADRLALQYGTPRQQVEAAYQLAWTWCWWFEDYQAVFSQYAVVEERARDSENVYDLERLVNLWTVVGHWLSSGLRRASELDWLDAHTAVLRNDLARLAGDAARPSVSLQARTLLIQMDLIEKLREGGDTEEVFAELGEVVESVEGLVGYPFEPLVELFTVFGEAIEDSPGYDSLFDKIIATAARRDGEVRAARLLLKRSEQLMDQERPAKAIALVGQALGRLYKHETRREIVSALFLCAHAYERVGLLWAARATYLFGASIAVNDFWTYGSLNRGFAACVDALKRIELRLGRLPQLLAWHELDMVVRGNLGAAGVRRPGAEEREASFDALLAHMLIRTPPEDQDALRSLPDALERLKLYTAAGAVLFLLGHTEQLAAMAEAPDHDAGRLAELLWKLKADVTLPQTVQLYENRPVTLSTKILGCRVTAECSPASPGVEVAEWVLSMLESFLATSGMAGAFAQEPLVTMRVFVDEGATEALSFIEEERQGRPHFVVRCRPFDPYETPPSGRPEIQEKVWELTANLAAHMVQFRDAEAGLTSLFREERVLDRAAVFTGTTGTVRNVLGAAPKFRLAQWIRPDATAYPIRRAEPWEPSPAAGAAQDAERPKPKFSEENEVPEGLFDPEKLSHEQMEMMSPIRHRLWERAKWSGCLFQWYPDHNYPPILGLLFAGDKAAALEIFSSWRAEFGSADEGRTLRLTVVRGINRSNPYAYRLLIGANPQAMEDGSRIFMMMSRVHQMDAPDPKNLEGFLKKYEEAGRFFLVPAYFSDGVPELLDDPGLRLHEIHVRNAWEIGRHDPDGVGVQADDDILIPYGIETPPAADLLAWKRGRKTSDTG